jgi:hypothetical protein
LRKQPKKCGEKSKKKLESGGGMKIPTLTQLTRLALGEVLKIRGVIKLI